MLCGINEGVAMEKRTMMAVHDSQFDGAKVGDIISKGTVTKMHNGEDGSA